MNISLQQEAALNAKVLDSFKELVDIKIFDAFFRDVKIGRIDGINVYFVCPSELSKTILSDKYHNDFEFVFAKITDTDLHPHFVLEEELPHSKKEIEEDFNIDFFKNVALQPQLNFDTFVVGDSNKEAQKASLFVANNPGTMFQTLFIYGGSGLGKTHLLNAIGNEIKRLHPEQKVLYCSSQDFLNEYLDFVSNGNNSKEQLNKYLKKFDVFLIDDIQMLKDKRKTQEFFFNIYEDFRQNRKQFVITSDKLPSELDGIDTRIITRFTSGLAVPIYKPDTDTCARILREKIMQGETEVKKWDDDVIFFLADRFKDSIRGLEGALIRLNFYARINNVDHIDINICSEALQGMIDVSQARNKVTVQKILNTVATYYGLSVSQITGKVKTEKFVNARHVAIFIIRDIMDLPFKRIGEVFSNRDHSTIMHSYQRVESMLKTDRSMKIVVDELKKRLES